MKDFCKECEAERFESERTIELLLQRCEELHREVVTVNDTVRSLTQELKEARARIDQLVSFL